jgi:hypothetical protein
MNMNRTTTKLSSALLTVAALLAGGSARAKTLQNLEAVDTNGLSLWTPAFPLAVTGVILNDPGEMLDSTPNFLSWNSGANIFQLGGQWQIFVQAVLPGDRGGVECWMGQNYGNLPGLHSSAFSYDNATWSSEVTRVSHDPATARAFRKGDLVTVTANASLFHGGMQNINEEHSIDPAYDFTVSLVSSNYGLPAPEALSLSSLISTNLSPTGHYDIFDATRATGAEHWQGMRIRLNGLTLATTNGWNTNSPWSARFCTATDGEGRQFPVVHPLYDIGPAPTNTFDAIGILLQESGSDSDGTFGYELFVQEVAPSATAALAIATKPVITWPGSLFNYQLQYTNTVGAPGLWQPATNVPALLNGRWTVILDPADVQTRFYRLQRIQ